MVKRTTFLGSKRLVLRFRLIRTKHEIIERSCDEYHNFFLYLLRITILVQFLSGLYILIEINFFINTFLFYLINDKLKIKRGCDIEVNPKSWTLY